MDSTSNYSLADLSAAMGNGGGMSNWMNNPFMYLIWLAYLGGNGFGLGGGRAAQGTQDAELMAQIAGLRSQIQDNQNTNSLQTAVSSNHDFLHGLGNSMNMGFAGTSAAINQASTGNLLGQKDAAAQMASCCCDIKSNILSQTNALQSRIDQLANGVTQGFSAVAYANQQQTNELSNAIGASTQRIVDQLNASTTQELRDKLLEASQTAQTATIISSLKSSSTTTA